VNGRTATTHDETPLFFPAGGETLFGILTHPTVPANGTGVVLLHGGGYTGSAHRNRASLRQARSLAAHGFHVMRFDYHGMGESSGVVEEIQLGRPFTEDLDGVMDVMRSHGVADFILVGQCFGGRAILSLSPRIPDLRGVVLLAIQIRDFGRNEGTAVRMAHDMSSLAVARRGWRALSVKTFTDRDTRRRTSRLVKTLVRAKVRSLPGRIRSRMSRNGNDMHWVSPRFMEPFQSLIEDRVPLLLVFGDLDGNEDFHEAKKGRLGSLLDANRDLVEVHTLAGRVHGLSQVSTQNELQELIESWILQRTIMNPEPSEESP